MCNHNPKNDIFMPTYEDDHPEGVEYISTLTPQQQEYLDKMEEMMAKFVTPPDLSYLNDLLKDAVNSLNKLSEKVTGDIRESRENRLFQLEEQKVKAIIDIGNSLKTIANYINRPKSLFGVK